MTDLQELPDHHGFEHGSEPARGDDVSVGREHEMVQPGKERRVLERLLDMGLQVAASTDVEYPIDFCLTHVGVITN